MEQAIWSFSVIMEKLNNLTMITQLVSVTTRVSTKLIFLTMVLHVSLLLFCNCYESVWATVP